MMLAIKMTSSQDILRLLPNGCIAVLAADASLTMSMASGFLAVGSHKTSLNTTAKHGDPSEQE